MLINMTPEDFMTFVLIYLLDKINNQEELRPIDPEIDELMSNIQVIRSYLTRFYLQTDGNKRVVYNRMRKAFDRSGYSRRYTINILDDVSEAKNLSEESGNVPIQDDVFMVKEIVKDAVKQVQKRELKTNFPLSESSLENIVSNSIKYIKNKKEL